MIKKLSLSIVCLVAIGLVAGDETKEKTLGGKVGRHGFELGKNKTVSGAPAGMPGETKESEGGEEAGGKTTEQAETTTTPGSETKNKEAVVVINKTITRNVSKTIVVPLSEEPSTGVASTRKPVESPFPETSKHRLSLTPSPRVVVPVVVIAPVERGVAGLSGRMTSPEPTPETPETTPETPETEVTTQPPESTTVESVGPQV